MASRLLSHNWSLLSLDLKSHMEAMESGLSSSISFINKTFWLFPKHGVFLPLWNILKHLFSSGVKYLSFFRVFGFPINMEILILVSFYWSPEVERKKEEKKNPKPQQHPLLGKAAELSVPNSRIALLVRKSNTQNGFASETWMNRNNYGLCHYNQGKKKNCSLYLYKLKIFYFPAFHLSAFFVS